MTYARILRISLVIFVVLQLSIQNAVVAQESIVVDYAALADKCDGLLRESIVDFYLPHSLDTKNGGYLETIDADGKFCASEFKFLTLQSRHLWFFSQLVRNDIEKQKSLAAAKSGFDFLQKHFLDSKHGGYFSRVKMDGAEHDTRKHIYLNAFAMYGLSLIHI